ncbi:hypothetical protein HDU97_005748 [Phlyctochytrium planicorne]|nr:hypothetical protein HDU97_005748 [Phlyctochytrium planicorne]
MEESLFRFPRGLTLESPTTSWASEDESQRPLSPIFGRSPSPPKASIPSSLSTSPRPIKRDSHQPNLTPEPSLTHPLQTSLSHLDEREPVDVNPPSAASLLSTPSRNLSSRHAKAANSSHSTTEPDVTGSLSPPPLSNGDSAGSSPLSPTQPDNFATPVSGTPQQPQPVSQEEAPAPVERSDVVTEASNAFALSVGESLNQVERSISKVMALSGFANKDLTATPKDTHEQVEEKETSNLSSSLSPPPDATSYSEMPQNLISRRPSKGSITSIATPNLRYRYSLSATSSSSNAEFESGDGSTTAAFEVAAILSGSTTAINSDDSSLASKRKNQEWHDLFPTVPKDELLIDEYNCAWQKEVLMQGKMYLSSRRICFNSNIFGWTQSLNLDFDDIHIINKKSVGGIIPNAIEVVMIAGTSYFFASFIQRDVAYENIVKTWGGPSRSIRLRTFRLEATSGEDLSLDSYASSEEMENHPSKGAPTLEHVDAESGYFTPPLLNRNSDSSASDLDIEQPKSLTNRFANELIEGMDRIARKETSPGKQWTTQIADGTVKSAPSSARTSPVRKSSLPQIGEDKLLIPSPLHGSSSQQVTLGFPVERRLSVVSITKGLADLAESLPGSPALSEDGSSAGGSSGPSSATTSHPAIHASSGIIPGVRNHHIVFQKHPVNPNQIKLEAAHRPKSPVVSPDKVQLGGAHHDRSTSSSLSVINLASNESLASSPSSPMIDLTPHMDNALSRKAATIERDKDGDGAKTEPSKVTVPKKADGVLLRTPRKVPKRRIIPSSPSKCPCEESHKKMTHIFTGTFSASVSRLWELLYLTPGKENIFFRDFITAKRKCQNLVFTDWHTAASTPSSYGDPGALQSPSMGSNTPDAVQGSQCTAGHAGMTSEATAVVKSVDMVKAGSHRHVEYVVPLTNPLGPKTTRCQVREIIEHIDSGGVGSKKSIEEVGFVCIRQLSITPDVPAGNTFITHLKVCISRVSATESKIRASCEVDFIKSSWIQSVLKSAVPDGMRGYYKELEPFLADYISRNPEKLETLEMEVIDADPISAETKESFTFADDPVVVKTDSLEHPLSYGTKEIEKLEVEERQRKLAAEALARQRALERSKKDTQAGAETTTTATEETGSKSLRASATALWMLGVISAVPFDRKGVLKSDQFRNAFIEVMETFLQSPGIMIILVSLVVLACLGILSTATSIVGLLFGGRRGDDEVAVARLVEETVQRVIGQMAAKQNKHQEEL